MDVGTLSPMRLESIKAGIALVWVGITCASAARLGIDSMSGWGLFAIVAALPPLAMWRLWNDPGQTLSESIDQARR